MYHIGVLGEHVEGEEPVPNEQEAIKLAYDRSMADSRCHTVSKGDNILFLAWGGHFFKKHNL